jgi:hypothetical protein
LRDPAARRCLKASRWANGATVAMAPLAVCKVNRTTPKVSHVGSCDSRRNPAIALSPVYLRFSRDHVTGFGPRWSEGPDLGCAIAHRGISRFLRCAIAHRSSRFARPGMWKISPTFGCWCSASDCRARPVRGCFAFRRRDGPWSCREERRARCRGPCGSGCRRERA